LLDGGDYEASWKQELGALMTTSVVNRAVYSHLGNRGYQWFLRYIEHHENLRALLYRQYHPSRLKRLLQPLLRWHYRSHRENSMFR